jgi:hypothetical protein
VRLAAHGIELDLPTGWDGRIYRTHGSDPIMHAATFPLPRSDGDFGSGATERMPPSATFLALKEYRPGPRLLPGQGLFASRSIPLPLGDQHFSSRMLQVTRVGQAGFQHFFTDAGRPLCLYAVVSADRPAAAGAVIARDQLENLNRILTTLTIASAR